MRLFLLAFLLPLAACGQGEPAVEVHDVWARSAEAGRATAVYFTLQNSGGAPDRLLGVATESARAAELHESTVDAEGVMRMRPVEAVEIPAGEAVAFEPGGYHVMLIDLARDLRPDERVALTLRFEASGAREVQAEVRTARP